MFAYAPASRPGKASLISQATVSHKASLDPGRLTRAIAALVDGRGFAAEEFHFHLRGKAEPYVLRDLALLKLFFGADAHALAEGQPEVHRQKLAEQEAIAEHDPGTGRRGPWQALELGIRHEREAIQFWEEQARGVS
jgi:hypothetical protein